MGLGKRIDSIQDSEFGMEVSRFYYGFPCVFIFIGWHWILKHTRYLYPDNIYSQLSISRLSFLGSLGVKSVSKILSIKSVRVIESISPVTETALLA